MSYWKGLMIAAAIDLVWIMGSPALAPDRQRPATEPTWVMNPAEVPVTIVEQRPGAEVDRLVELSNALDSLMMYLEAHPEDIDAIENVAEVYAENGWWDAAIGPLARAIQIDPERWSLWSSLDRALEKAGIATMTDAELTVRAADFVEAVKTWGHGC